MHSAVNALKEFEAVTCSGSFAVNIAVTAILIGMSCITALCASGSCYNAFVIVIACRNNRFFRGYFCCCFIICKEFLADGAGVIFNISVLGAGCFVAFRLFKFQN